jgi:hypothetical protein
MQYMSREKPVILVGIVSPSHFYFPHPYIISLLTMMTYCYSKKVVEGINFSFQNGPKTATNRNRVLEKAQGKCHYVLFIDTDMTFEMDTIEKLVATAEANPGSVVTGIGCIGQPPFRPAIFTCEFEEGERPQHIEVWPDEPFEVGACGSFCMLIPMPIIDKLGVKCFTHINDYYGSEVDHEDRELRHDLAFSKRVRDAGFKIICDPSVSVGHLRLYPATVQDWIQNRDFKPPKPLGE